MMTEVFKKSEKVAHLESENVNLQSITNGKNVGGLVCIQGDLPR